MNLWGDLERMASRCKHSDAPLDPNDVRALCRRAQAVVGPVTGFDRLDVARDDGGGWQVTVTFHVDSLDDLLGIVVDDE
jgi:hypothetical protein